MDNLIRSKIPTKYSFHHKPVFSRAVDQARVRGGRRVTGHYEKVRAGGAGRRIVSEAREIHAAAIVMPLPAKRAGSSLFGRTLETVLAERPCRVIIDSSLGMPKAQKKEAVT